MEFIVNPKAPPALGPYSHAVRSGNTLYICGQVPFHPQTGDLVGANMAEQTKQTMQNLLDVLEAAGLSMKNVLKATVFVTEFNRDFAAFNTVYAEFMGGHKPARACVEVKYIAKGALLEIEAVAEFPS